MGAVRLRINMSKMCKYKWLSGVLRLLDHLDAFKITAMVPRLFRMWKNIRKKLTEMYF